MRSYFIVLTLSLISSIIEARESSLMQTLNCSTDYDSYTACTWFEHQEARSLINMSLLILNPSPLGNNVQREPENMACSSQKVGSQIRWKCHKNQDTIFLGMENIFIFKPERSLDVQLNISFFNNVQPLPPQNLVVNITEDGDSFLIWEAGNGIIRNNWLENSLDFEVTYKRFWESWEESSSLLVSNASQCLLQHLVPGNTYVARVRSKPGRTSQFVGHYSDWSSVVIWDTPEGKVEAQPKNVHCQFKGIDQLKCSWEVRQEISSSILFALFYKDNTTSQEKECFPVHETELPPSPLKGPKHVLQSCEISVTSPNGPSQYFVTVRPKEEKRTMEMAKRIKAAPPYNLSVTDLNYQAYKLQWKATAILDNIPQIYRILYWETGNPLEVKYVDASFDKVFTFTSKFLKLGSSYTAKVQAKVNGRSYDGPWSEWSKEIQWTTKDIFPPWGILLIGVISIILIMVVLYCCYKYLLCKKRKWDAAIPSPPRTLLLPDFFQKVELSDGLEDSSRQSSSKLQGFDYTKILEREMPVTHPESLPAESRKTEQHSLVSQDMEEIKLPNVSKAGQFLTQSVEKAIHSSHQVQIFDYDGPYLHLPPESSVRDVSQDVQIVPSKKTEIYMSLKHMKLPHCLYPQQLPVEKEKEAVPSFLTISDGQGEKKQQLLKRQEGSQRDTYVKEDNKTRGTQHLPGTNNSGQNGPLDYIATENLPVSQVEGSLHLIPVVASEKEMPACSRMATDVPETSADLSSSMMDQKKPDTVLPTKGQMLAIPSVTPPKAFDDYVMSLPATPGSTLKEGLGLSTEEPKHNKGFFIFNPDNKSPIFLSQVGDYCFFPSFKLNNEPLKNPKGTLGHGFSETGSKVTNPLDDANSVGSKLQTTISPLPRLEF
ncbi:cytokine receptor common subunit beta [Anolis carolinensis]|uniref:cytokine receptor common subunit beta n=1 Tax=Anolis carolinensis TaxID=28377 RepID=UPI002F2B6E3A